jgi:hypothetical protein
MFQEKKAIICQTKMSEEIFSVQSDLNANAIAWIPGGNSPSRLNSATPAIESEISLPPLYAHNLPAQPDEGQLAYYRGADVNSSTRYYADRGPVNSSTKYYTDRGPDVNSNTKYYRRDVSDFSRHHQASFRLSHAAPITPAAPISSSPIKHSLLREAAYKNYYQAEQYDHEHYASPFKSRHRPLYHYSSSESRHSAWGSAA